MSKVVIVGGGAAGMFASLIAAENGHEVHVIEKNEKLGKKLFITGKGRCNITNACDIDDLFANMVGNKKFMYSAFYGFTNQDMMDFLTKLGLKVKVERGARVFPESDKSSDVLAVLQKEMRKRGVVIHLNQNVKELLAENGNIIGVRLANKEQINADSIIIATGGCSYPSTGSTGDGYLFAKKVGHTVTELSAGLVPFEVKEDWVKELQGITLKNIRVTIYQNQKELYSDFGELLFTHFGVSGPLVISASSLLTKEMKKGELILSLDLKAALSFEQLETRLLREFDQSKNKQLSNILDSWLPKRMIPIMLDYLQINGEKKVHDISKEERRHIISSFKDMRMTVTGFRDFNEAIITRGGVSVREVSPSTMESKIVKNLYFIGEVLDVDAMTGGFNLQIAWSCAYAAAMALR